MTENNAAQPGLTDELSIAINMLISDAKALAHVKAKGYDASDAERCFQVAQDRLCTLLSKLRAEGVRAGDERGTFKEWDRLFTVYCGAAQGVEAGKAAEALVAFTRAALASAPVADPYPARLMHERDNSLAERVDSWHQRNLSAPVACNCPGGNKPADLHAPNCPVRQSNAKLLDPYDGGTWVASAPVANPIKWPTMPASKGQSPVLFEDGYAEGWAKCMDECRRAVSQASAPVAGEAQKPFAWVQEVPGYEPRVFLASRMDDPSKGHWRADVKWRALVLADAAPQASAEPLARYCPGCGSVGPVGDEYRDCCPDGNQARMIPKRLAEQCRETFRLAIQSLLPDVPANDGGAPEASEAVRNQALDDAEEAVVTLYESDDPVYLPDIALAIRALKAQADKDGADCAKGAGDERAWQRLTDSERDGFVGELVDYGTDFVSPLYAVVESIERLLREKNAAPSVVKQSLTATQTGEKGESE